MKNERQTGAASRRAARQQTQQQDLDEQPLSMDSLSLQTLGAYMMTRTHAKVCVNLSLRQTTYFQKINQLRSF
jgi:hypothetical protein